MPRGYKGKSRVRGGSTKGQPKAKGKGSPGGEMTRRLTKPSGRP
jgi:hypothetical protein